MRVTVVGAGKMGLPLACQFASKGAYVTACDINKSVVEKIKNGICPIDEPGLESVLKSVVSIGHLDASCDTGLAVAQSDVVVVIVPVLLTEDNHADTSVIEAVAADIAAGLKSGTMISFETTLPVGGTRKLISILESSGLKAGDDFDLVFSPERVKSQLVLQRLSETPKVVGGITSQSAARAADFYHKYLGAPVINVGTLEAAELVKLAGMVYRDVNIALSNELARYAAAVGVDFSPVIAAANTDGEANLLTPGIGVGGHCTPVYPHFLINDAMIHNTPATLAEKSRRINDSQPGQILQDLERVWQPLNLKRVIILGLGFRPNVKEALFSPAFLLREELKRRNCQVYLHDSLYSDEEIKAYGFGIGALDDGPMPEVLILNTAHSQYVDMDFQKLASLGLKAVVDGRNLWSQEVIEAAGIIYVGIGRANGAMPIAQQMIQLSKPSLTGNGAEAAADVVRSGWIMQGPQVDAFEKEFAEYMGAKHACAVSSGTAALHLALLAVGIEPGDEVITVSHSFIATANAIRYCGAVPIFVDIKPETFNIDPALVEAAITERTKAIVCVHQMGMPCDLSELSKIVRRHSLPLIEDAACATGSEVLWNGNWEKIGKPHGDIACFSFHPRKVITTGDGGMITTSNSDYDSVFRLLRNHGMTMTTAQRNASKSMIPESYSRLGYNYRMTDMQAAVGREQLRRLSQIVERRRHLKANYDYLLREIPDIKIPTDTDWARSNWQSYCISLPANCNQQDIMDALAKEGVSSRRGVMCAHMTPAYRIETWSCGSPLPECKHVDGICARLKHSEHAQDDTLTLPLYDSMTERDQEKVVHALFKLFVAKGQKVYSL